MTAGGSSVTRPRFLLLSAILFVAAGLALYARALRVPFVADDWEFLVLVDTSHSIGVCFALLVGRFVRPLVMLTYYTGHMLFGLWPAPYHLAAILLHALNAWLLCLVVTSLDRSGRRWIGLVTGLLFLAFAGHTEAVTWVAGLADVFVAACLLGTLLAADGARGSVHPGRFALVIAVLTAIALLGKESAVVLPAVLAAYVLLSAADVRHARPWLLLVPPLVVVATYWIVRTWIYGTPTDAYGGLGAYEGSAVAHGRAMLIRAFLPASNRAAEAWQRGLDVPGIFVAAIAIAAAAWRDAKNRRALGFSLGALACTLAPAFPLSLSLATTESERMFYVPTAFAAIVTVLVVDALVRPRALKAAILVALIGAHAVLLQRMHLRWQAAGETFAGVTRSFVDQVRLHDPGAEGLVFLLSMPDNVRGAYVFRRGFYAALHFIAPDLAARGASIVPIESQTMTGASDESRAARVSAMRFTLDVSPNMFLSVQPPVRPFYAFPSWTRSGYLLEFTPAIGRAAVFGVSAGRTAFLGDVTGPGAPFGTIDIPDDGAACDGRLRFSGWALDDTLVTGITALRDASPADRIGSAGVRIGEGSWASGTRPDVAAVYRGFPHTDRAEWNVSVDCGVLATLPEQRARVRIRASDAAGHTTEIGARTIVLGRSRRIPR